MDPLTVTIVGGVAVTAITAGTQRTFGWLRRRRSAPPAGVGELDGADAVDPRPSIEPWPEAPAPSASTEGPLGQEHDPAIVHNLGSRPDLVGRTAHLRTLQRRLAALRQPIVLFGSAGIGKSSVAVELGYQIVSETRSPRATSPGYSHVLFFSGRSNPLELTNLLDEVARWTGNLYVMKLAAVADKRVEIVKLLGRTRVLLIVDNLETVEDPAVFAFIGEVPFPSQVLGTSRRIHDDLPSARHIELPAISVRSSDQLLQRELQRTPVSPTQVHGGEDLSLLEGLVHGNPLAIRWAAGQLQMLPAASVVETMQGGEGHLFQNLFERSWRELTQPARRALYGLTHFRGPASVEAIAAVAGVDRRAAGDILREIGRFRLLEPVSDAGSSERRFALHPLTSAFAASRHGELEPGVVENTELAFVAYYEAFVDANGGRDWDDPEPFERLDKEHDNCAHAAGLAFNHRRWESVVRFADRLRNYLLIYGYWNQRLELCHLALRAAGAMHDLRARAHFLRHIGWTLVLRGDLDEAGTHLAEARALAGDEGDIKAEADAVGDLAEIARLNGNLAEARELRTQSLALSEQAGNQRDVYVERTLLAQIALEERDLEVARNGFMESLRIAQELRWHRAIAYCFHWLGDVARSEGDHELAHSYLAQSRTYLARFHDRARLALILKSEALLAAAEQDAPRARRLALEARDELLQLGLPYELGELESLLRYG